MSIEDNSYTLNEAISLHRQTLQLQPAPHPDRSTSLSNLASALLIRFEKEGQGYDLDDAIFLHREALELQPSPHLYQSTFLDDLSSALSIQCEQKGIKDFALICREKEKPLEVVIIEKMKHVLEDDDSDMLRSMTNLAFIYKYQGRWKEAEALEMVVMEKRRYLLGEQHSDTPASMANLATTYSNQGQFKEAEASRAKTW
jgi:tetratricopeptide (TPR) repeat protein